MRCWDRVAGVASGFDFRGGRQIAAPTSGTEKWIQKLPWFFTRGVETVDKLSGAVAPKAPSDEGKRSAVAVVNDSPVDCQSCDRPCRSKAVSKAD